MNLQVNEISEVVPAVKRMKLRYAGVCALCESPIDAGVRADYHRDTRTVTCLECPGSDGPARPGEAETDSSGEHMPSPAGPADVAPVGDSPGTADCGEAEEVPSLLQDQSERAELLEAVDGTAGASAVQEFDRRHDARQQRVKEKYPRMGRVLLAVFGDPQSTTAWSTGAVGEQKVGQMLAEVAGPTLRVLHDRRIPRTRANIDHLVVCPTGVYVIDAKRYCDARPELRVEGGILRPRVEFLYVGGRNRTKLVDGVAKQVGLVEAALDGSGVSVHGVLCFVDADWPLLFGGPFRVRGVLATYRKKLKATLSQPGPLDEEQIADLQYRLHEAFPRQSG